MKSSQPRRSPQRRGMARRTWAALVALVLALSQALGAAGAHSRAGAAGLDKLTVTNVVPMMERYPDIGTYRHLDCFTVDNGYDGIAFCGAMQMTAPSKGTSYSNGRVSQNAALDYVMYHGHGGPGDDRPKGLSEGRWYLATSYAVWAVMPDSAGNSHDQVYAEIANAYPDARAAFNDLVDAAQAYAEAGGGGAEEGCAIVWPSPDGRFQTLVTRVEPTGGIELEKASSAPSVSGNNPCYSLAGAIYTVYSDKACKTKVTTLTTDARGHASATGLKAGTYYVRETTPAKGFSLDDTLYTVSVSGGVSTRVGVSDAPQGNPVSLVLAKVDAETGEAAPQGDASLEGAQFEVSFYAGHYDSLDALPESPTRSWLVRTSPDGRALLDAEHLVSGDALYTNTSGKTILPLGTVTIREVKAPEGYVITDASTHLQKITSDGTSETVSVFAAPTFQESVARGGVCVPKIDHELEEGVAQGDATLAGATLSIVNRSDADVVVDGVRHAPGEEVMTIVTGEDGTASTSADALPYGTYSISEKDAPEGYLLNEDWSVTFSVQEDGTIVDLSGDPLPEDVARGGVSLPKVDHDLRESVAQGAATLAGAVISITNASEGPVMVDGVLYQSGDVVATMETGEDGSAGTSADLLPYGTYELAEVRAPEGYLLNESWSATFSIRSAGEMVSLSGAELDDQVARGGVVVRKVDAETGAGRPQGDASLAGAVFQITSKNTNPVVVGGTTYQSGQVVATITSNDAGEAKTGERALPIGAYEVREAGSPEGYLVNEGWARNFKIEADGQMVDLSADSDAVGDQVIRGGVALRKADREIELASAPRGSEPSEEATQRPRSLGAAVLEGAQIEIENSSNHAVLVDGVSYDPGETVMTLVTDASGTCSTSDDALPYGTYTARETVAPDGYLLNDGWRRVFSIREDGVVVDLTRGGDVLQDQVIRGDLSFTKAEEGSQNRMAGIPFLLTSKTTGESHVLVSDENGMVNTSSRWNSHESATNANDAALSEEGVVDEGALDDDAGVWFHGGTNVRTVPNDALGALPYDTYVLEELSCTANEGHRLVSTEVTISRHSVCLDIGTMDDEVIPDPVITTLLLSDATSDHDAPSYDASTVTDTARLANLQVGQTYTVSGELRLVERNEKGEPVVGETLDSAETTVVATSESMNVQLRFSLDGVALAGRTVNASETLICEGEVVAAHDDVTDENQTLRIPSVSTAAANGETGDQTSPADKDQTLVDTVSLTNLMVGRSYRLVSSAHAKNVDEDGTTSDGGVLPGGGEDGQAATELTFVAESESMEVVVEIPYDASGLDGRDTVAFEELYRDNVLVAVHANVDDAFQTLHVPSVRTEALAESTGSQELPAQESQVVTDTVHLENLAVGEEYELTSTIHRKGVQEDGQTVDLGEVIDGDGKPVTATTVFTAEQASMDVEVSLEVDARELAGQEVVFFEELSRDEVLLAVHADINDEAQTLSVPAPPEETTPPDAEEVPKTGEAANMAVTIGFAGATLAGIGAYLVSRRRTPRH